MASQARGLGPSWWLAIGALSVLASAAYAQDVALKGQQPENRVTTSDWGGVGLLQMRTARMQPDGAFDFGMGMTDPYLRYGLTWQFLPWLEATFRYTDIKNVPYLPNNPARTGQSYKDRGADLKFRLREESLDGPELALGFQDGLGTGLFTSEYLVGSKRWFDFDFTLGLAWGYLGSQGGIRNPFTVFGSSFERRQTSSDFGGTPQTAQWFKGREAAIFGGVEWRTPYDGLWLKAEYDTISYTQEPFARFQKDWPFNFGAVYRPFPYVETSVGFERGNTAMYRVTLKTNFHTLEVPKSDPAAQAVRTREAVARAIARGLTGRTGDGAFGDRESALAAGLFDLVEARGLTVERFDLRGDQIAVGVSGAIGAADLVALRRAAQSLAGAFPVSIDRALPPLFAGFASDIDQSAIVDHLFEGLESEGLSVGALDVTDREATLHVENGRERVARIADRAARLVFDAVPAPIGRVVIVDQSGGRTVLTRSEIRRRAQVDRLFDELESQGFDVEQLDFSETRATVIVAALGRATGIAPRVAAIVADAAPNPLDEVTVLSATGGVVETRLTLRRRDRLWEPIGRGGPGDPHRLPLDPESRKAIAARLFEELARQGFKVDAIDIDDLRATVHVEPERYPQPARNIGRAARVVADNVPQQIEVITVATMNLGIEIGRTSIMRADLERALGGRGSPEEIFANARFEEPAVALGGDAIRNPGRYPDFDWNLAPRFRQHIGGAAQFYLYQVALALEGQLDVAQGLNVQGSFSRNIANNFDKISTVSDSQLAHVRSDVADYLRQGQNSISNLQTNYMFVPAQNWFGRLSAGYFEEMFGGFGGELLYRPLGSRLAYSVNAYRAQQRDFNQQLGFRDYGVMTGHATVYYKFPYKEMLGSISVGQYLAGDRGATFRLGRQFESGVEVGTWSTFTNVSASQYGEGSFDKGFYFRIPFDVFTGGSTRRTANVSFSPLSRDGGAMIQVNPELYRLTEEGNLDLQAKTWHRILD